MNRIFKTIWSKVNHQTVVVSEAQGTQSSRKADKRVRSLRSGGMALTAAAAAVMAATMGSAQAAIDTSTWTVTGSDAVLSQDLDYTGATYGRIQGFSGWAGTDTNKLTIAAGSTITGGVFGYENDPFWGDESNTGAEGSSGLLRYHTFVVNGALKDADTYHDVATNADKPQVGTVNWFNRLALGTTGVVNVKEVRLAEAFKNEGSFTVNDFYVKEGAELENSGTMTITGNAVIGTANANIFDKNLYDISGEELTAGTSGTFTNSGTMTVNGTLTNFSNITDTESAGNWTVNKFLNGQVATTTGNEIKPSMRIAKDMHIKDTLWNNGTVEIGGNLTVDVYGTGTEDSADKVEKDSSNSSDSSTSLAYTSTAYTKNLGTLKAGSMNLTGIKNYITSSYLETTDSTTTSSLGIVTNGGTIKLAGNANLTALNQIAAHSKDSEGTTSTVVMPIFTAQKDVTIEGLLKNVARDYTYDAAQKGGVIDVKGNLSAQDIVSTGTITANNLTSGKDILNYGTIKTVGNITNTTTITNYGLLTAGGKLSTDELLNDETVTITSANIAKVNNQKNFTVTGDANTQVITNIGEVHLNNVLLTDMGAVDKSSSPITPALINRWDLSKQKIGQMLVTGKVTFDSSLAGKETMIANSGHMELGEVDGNGSKLTISNGSLKGEMVLNGNVKAYLLENSSGRDRYIKANNIDIEVSAVSNGNVLEVCGAGSKLTGVKKLTATSFVDNAGILEAKEIIAGTLSQGDPYHFGSVNFDDPQEIEDWGFDGNVTTTAEKITVGNYEIYGPSQRIKLELTGTEDSQITGSYKTYLSSAETNEHSKLSKLISNSSLSIGGEFDNASQVQIAQNLTLGKTLANHVYSNVADSGNINVQGTLRWDAYKQTYSDDDGTKEVTSFNDGKIVAGILQGAGIDNHVGATLEATNAAASSSLGIVSNLGTITLAGKSTFAAVTNAGTINLAADTSMASLTQTAAAGKTSATAGLNVTGAIDNQAGSITAGTFTAGSTVKNADTMTVTGAFTAADTVTNAKTITAGTFDFQNFVNNANAVLKSTDADSDTGSTFGATDNKGEINLAGIANFGAVKNAGTVKLAAEAYMASLTQTAGTVTAQDALNVEGALDNQAGSITADSLSVATTLTNADTITVTNAVAATGKTVNSKTITAGILNLADVDNAAAGVIKSTATTKSVFGATDNKGEINLAGASEFGAVTNANKLTLTGDAVLASLTQTAGTTTAGAGLTLSADSATAGTVSVTGLLTAAGLTNTGSVTAAQLSGKTYTGSGTSELSVTDSATLGSLALSDSGRADVTKSLTLGTSASDTGSVAAGTTLTVGETLSVVKGAALTIASGAVVSADTLALGDASSAGSATVNSSSASFKHLTAANGGSVLTNGTDLTLDDVNVADGFTYNQTAGSFKTADNSFFKNATLNIRGGTLDRTGGNTRAAGDNTLGTGNTVNISGVTPGSFTDKTQVGSDWKDGQTVVSVGILNSDSTVNLKSGGILETSNIGLTSNTLHFDGGALTASLINFFDGVSEKVYKITDGSETTIDTNVLGAADVSDVKDSFKDNIDFTANGGTIVITDAAVSLKAIASASDKLKALAGEGADNVNVVFTGTAAGSSGTLTGFFHNTYQELAAEQGQASSFKNPGVVFATMAYENRAEDGGATRDKLVVGTTTEAADTFVLGDSIGFARVEGTDNVTVNSGKTLALIGGAAGTNLLDSAAGTLTVTGADSKFVMGTKGVAGTEGALGTLNVTESGAMTVAMGKYTVTNLALTKGTGSTDVGTTLTVAKLTDDAASTFDNKGTLSVASVDTVNSAFTNSGTFNVASNTVLANTFTNTAGRAVFDGTVEMQKAVTNAKDATIKTAGFTVSSALTGSAGNVINNAGRLESTGANTVAGSMVVAKDGSLVATDVTNITTGRINVLGDSRFKEVNVGVNGSGALGAAADALIHADTITVGTMGQLRLRDGATVVAKNLKVDGMMSAGNVSWALGSAAVNGWNKKNADRYATLMGEYATTTAMLFSLSSCAVFDIATYGADTVKSSVDHTVVASPAADAVILEAGNGEKYWIDTDRTADFSMPVTVGGTVGTSGNYFSANTDVNYTYTFDTAVVKADADATFMDISYILEGKTLTVNDGGTIFIEDTEDTDYQPGVMVVRGNLVNNGDIMSTDGTGLVVAGSGVVTIGSTGTDVGKTLVVTGDGTYKVDGGEADYAGLELKSGTLNVAKGWFGYGLAKADAGYTGDKSAIFATNLDTIETNDARLIVGTVAAGDTVTAGSVYFGEDSALVLDTSNLVDKTIFKGNNSGTFTVKVGSELAVSHTTWGKHYILGDGYDLSGFTDDAWNGDYIKNLTGDDMQLAVSKTEDGKLMLSAGAGEEPNPPTPDPDPDPDPAPTPDPDPDPDPTPDPDPDPNPNPQPDTSIKALSPDFAVPDVIDGLINDEANIGLRDPNSDKMDVAFIERVLDKNYVGTTADGNLDVKKATRLWNSVVEMSASSGSTAYSIGQVSDTMGMIEDRAAGMDLLAQKKDHLWVKPMGKYSKADKLKGEGSMTGGYEATTYGLMLGADASDESLTLGGALSYAKGDLKSRGDWTATDTDVELYGINAYGAVRQGKAAFIGHVGYAQSKGEAKQNFSDVQGNGYSVKSDIKNKMITAGLRGEIRFDVTDSVVVTPHLGIRYVKTKTDGYDITMNGKQAFKAGKADGDLWQLPLGVSVKADLWEGAWKLAPYADISVVRQFGDTDMTTSVSATSYAASDSYRFDVAGKTMGEVKLGISAERKNHSFGLSYTGAVGTQGTQTHALTAHYNYRF